MNDLTEPLSGLSVLASHYTGLLCDVWGVVHDGVSAHRNAVDALVRFRRAGGSVILITNSPSPAPEIVRLLNRLQVTRAAYDGVVSSGDVTRKLVSAYQGQTIHWVGPEGHKYLIAGLDLRLGPPETAAAVLMADPDTDDDTIELYEERLERWLALDLLLICANPDRVVEVGGRLVLCAGAIADIYAERGGKVIMAGKPYAPIYTEGLRLISEAGGREIRAGETLAIGDSVRTDAIGAAGIGADFLFITGSIHAGELHAEGVTGTDHIRDLLQPSGARVVGHMRRLDW
jgi:HAD superfamily hydrolase (TIGR01459 family)